MAARADVGSTRSVVAFDAVWKQYRRGAPSRSLRELLSSAPQRFLRRQPESDHEQHEFWALSGVSFELDTGSVLGIVGQNGAGKTTILKLLSGITQPTRGNVHVDGRVSALIELGAGFHPDLTGRENVYLNATILGLTRREIDEQFTSIVDFAELHDVIDTPVKRYSSGMYARLGFAVAAHTHPDLLLVDEVLGVGDTNFQRKCFDFIQSFVRGFGSAIFVSHNLYVLEQLCDRMLWVERGQVMLEGTPDRVLPKYFEHLERAALETRRQSALASDGLRLGEVQFRTRDGTPGDTFSTWDDVVVEIPYAATGRVAAPHFCLGVLSSGTNQSLFAASMLIDGGAPTALEGQGVARCSFTSVPLMPRIYELWGEVWADDRSRVVVRWQKLGSFRIVGTPDSVGDTAPTVGGISRMHSGAPIRVAHQWEFAPTDLT